MISFMGVSSWIVVHAPEGPSRGGIFVAFSVSTGSSGRATVATSPGAGGSLVGVLLVCCGGPSRDQSHHLARPTAIRGTLPGFRWSDGVEIKTKTSTPCRSVHMEP